MQEFLLSSNQLLMVLMVNWQELSKLLHTQADIWTVYLT